MKRVLTTAVLMGMLGEPAYSQKTPLQLQYEQQDRDRKESEQAYDEMLKRSKSQAPPATTRDPWARVRPAPEANTRR